MDAVNFLFGFQGRVNRGKFWLLALIWIVFLLIVVGLAAMVVTSYAALYRVGLIASIPIVVSAVSAGVRRLNDRNKNGWWLLVFYGIPLLQPLAGALLDAFIGLGSALLQYVSLAVILWALVELGCLRGTIGANQYGADPIAPEILTPPVHTH